MEEPRAHKKTQTIEQTGKTWKAFILIGAMLILIGLFSIYTPWGKALLAVGTILTITGKIGAWWYHG